MIVSYGGGGGWRQLDSLWHYHFSVAKFTLEKENYKVYEDEQSLDICVILKSEIKRDVNLYLDFDNGTAYGEQVNSIKWHCQNEEEIIYLFSRLVYRG